MSPPKYRIELSASAQRDWEDILAYTMQKWGAAQMDAYDALLERALDTLRWNPNFGHKREGLSERHRVVIAGQHVVVYSVSEDTVSVSRILHEKMDVARHLTH